MINFKRNLKFGAYVLALGAIFASCTPVKKISYFQDLQPGAATVVATPSQITIKPEDKISIVVNSKDPMLSDLFNLPIVSHRVGTGTNSSVSASQQISSYTVDQEGNVDFPVLGAIHVEGMSREQIASHIKKELIDRQLVNDPVVTVEFMNLSVSVIGEVSRPGRYAIDRDKFTVLNALSMAGDLTIWGQRDKVFVMREKDGQQMSYRLDLCSAQQLYSSEGYYLQQDDIVYVEPNSMRSRQSTVNGNNLRSTSFWLSLASLLTTITVLIVK